MSAARTTLEPRAGTDGADSGGVRASAHTHTHTPAHTNAAGELWTHLQEYTTAAAHNALLVNAEQASPVGTAAWILSKHSIGEILGAAFASMGVCADTHTHTDAGSAAHADAQVEDEGVSSMRNDIVFDAVARILRTEDGLRACLHAESEASAEASLRDSLCTIMASEHAGVRLRAVALTLVAEMWEKGARLGPTQAALAEAWRADASVRDALVSALSAAEPSVAEVAALVLARKCARLRDDGNTDAVRVTLEAVRRLARTGDATGMETDLHSSIVIVRALSLAAQIASASDESCAMVIESGLMHELIRRSLGDEAEEDVLMRMAALQQLPLAASTATGARFLIESGLPGGAFNALLPLCGLGSDADAADIDAFVGADALAAVAMLYSAAIRADRERYRPRLQPKVFPNVFHVLQEACAAGHEASESANAMSAVAMMLAVDDEALGMLLTPGHRAACREWLENAVSTDEELRAAVFSSLATIFGAYSAASPAAAEAAATLFELVGLHCGSSTTEVILSALRKPESAARHAALGCLAAALTVPSEPILRHVLGHPGAATYILDRSTESTKSGKEQKFAIVAAILGNTVAPALGESFLSHLRTYYQQGPFFVQTAAAGVTVMPI